MTKKIALMMNTNALGGAERSMVEQVFSLSKNYDITIFVPEIDHPSENLIQLINEKLSCEFDSYTMPMAFYRLSRDLDSWTLIKAFFSLLSLPFHALNLRKLLQFDAIYANGNKAAVWSIFCMTFLGYKGKLIWHFRDYPGFSKKGVRVFETLQKFMRFKIEFVANSFSVGHAVSETFKTKVDVIYNPVSMPDFIQKTKTLKRIGLVAMLAPWKGLHEIILFTHLFESELKKLGIEEVGIYTSDIYRTKGAHGGYLEELKVLQAKFPSSLIKFSFDKKPSEIFLGIDLLIHSSIRPEPFGRVILEAFGFGVPVISTALGGAAELIQNKKNGLVYLPNDHAGLFEAIKACTDASVYKNLVASGMESFKLINEQSRNRFEEFMSSI
jgi:glycosyltransferase involved in cell wall biosynthesis